MRKISTDLVQPAQVAIVLCRLHVALPEAELGKVEGEQVELLRLVQQKLVRGEAAGARAVYRDLLEDQRQHPLGGGEEQVILSEVLPHY